MTNYTEIKNTPVLLLVSTKSRSVNLFVESRLLSGWNYRYKRSVVLLASESHCAVNKCIERMILAHADVLTWMVLCATLTYDDVSSLSKLTTKNLQT